VTVLLNDTHRREGMANLRTIPDAIMKNKIPILLSVNLHLPVNSLSLYSAILAAILEESECHIVSSIC
jgi:hypothetical protein